MKTPVYFTLLLINIQFLPWSHSAFTTSRYDFIIVGSGSSGSVLANRLSEISQWKILLLEVGKKGNFLSDIPLAVPSLYFTSYNWNYKMEYQPGIAEGCDGRRMPWPRGRALGGTTVINYMIYTRGNKPKYDKWGERNPGWSYDEVLPYFKKSEDSDLDSRFHGKEGYLRVEEAYQTESSQLFIKALNEMGVKTIDYNSDETLGVSTVQATVKDGSRNSVYRAFIEPILADRVNLHIFSGAFVTRILINPITREAYGVEFELDGKTIRAEASKEVILSAGTFHSPQLLMLAGIGPEEHLKELGIPVLKNLAVGRNLEDHLSYWALSFSTTHDFTITLKSVINPLNLLEYGVVGRGPLSSIGSVGAIAYIKTAQSKERENIPDIELLFASISLATDYGLILRRSIAVRDDIFYPLCSSLFGQSTFLIMPILLHPKSKGHLKLRSRDPHEPPLLYGNFFTDPYHDDINTFVAAIRVIQEIVNTRAFLSYNVTFSTERVPGCSAYKYDSDGYWKCCLRSLATTVHHQVGTVKMGPRFDPGAVVDHKLRVYGIRKLRVADCSIIPFEVGAHTNIPAIMIGEKAADLIKEAWNV